VDLNDIGLYKCIATNTAGKIEKKFQVNVNEKPKISGGSEIELFTKEVGETGIFVCRIEQGWVSKLQKYLKNQL
jgi:hypothetical protein